MTQAASVYAVCAGNLDALGRKSEPGGRRDQDALTSREIDQAGFVGPKQ